MRFTNPLPDSVLRSIGRNDRLQTGIPFSQSALVRLTVRQPLKIGHDVRVWLKGVRDEEAECGQREDPACNRQL